MNVLIVGAGVVGESLAEQLSQEGHRVAVVDQDQGKVKALEDSMDVLAIKGNAGSPSVLRKAGIESAEMVIAVTDVDEVNLVVGMLAARMGVKHRIVRLRNQEYTRDESVLSLYDLGIEQVINPDPVMVKALVSMIDIPGATDFAMLANGQVLMLGFDVPENSPIAGRTLAELRKAGDLDAFLVLYITREDRVVVPKGDDRIRPGDNVHLLVSSDTVDFLPTLIHRRPPQVRNVIVTGSRLGLMLAQAIQDKVDRVFLVEHDREAATEAAASLERAVVLHGDETDLSVLQEAYIDRCDLFCALSNDEHKNMMAALLAKKNGVKQAAVLVNRPEYVSVMDSLGVEIVLNSRLVTVGEILTHFRRGHVHSVTRVAESKAEIIELEAVQGSAIAGTPLKNVKFPSSALIGAILKDDNMKIPDGDTIIEPGDLVVVFAMPEAIPGIEKLFTKRSWFKS